MSDFEKFAQEFHERMEKLIAFIHGDEIKDIMGTEAVNHFKQSFINEGFTDKTVEKWPEVERRKPGSSWYKPGKASASRKILSGETSELSQAISYRYIPGGVRITDAAPYASVHQFGEPANVFGKKPFTMKPRPFIGYSEVMKKNITNEILNEIRKITDPNENNI